jgi:hypothetical protein
VGLATALTLSDAPRLCTTTSLVEQAPQTSTYDPSQGLFVSRQSEGSSLETTRDLIVFKNYWKRSRLRETRAWRELRRGPCRSLGAYSRQNSCVQWRKSYWISRLHTMVDLLETVLREREGAGGMTAGRKRWFCNNIAMSAVSVIDVTRQWSNSSHSPRRSGP